MAHFRQTQTSIKVRRIRASPTLVFARMTDELTPLAPHGRRPDAPRDARGKWLSEPKGDRVTSRGHAKTYIVRRLSRDGRHDLTALVRNREISARQASIRAGWGGPPKTQRPEQPRYDVKAMIA
jgi:hypothetical protein